MTSRQRRLLGVLRDEDRPARDRVRAGNMLGRLGDPRFSPGHWMLPDDPLLGFVPIPAGTFVMGDGDPEGNNEPDDHHVWLDTYLIARWPVTVEQFGVFQHARGRPPIGRYTYPGGAGSTHPVVDVSWTAAADYCAWLEEEVRSSVSLPGALVAKLREIGDGNWRVVMPSEAEWEKAARGTDARPYPWGLHFDEHCVNVGERTAWSRGWDWPELRVEQGIDGTSPVGSYPNGASPYGVEDLIGNVEEWTRNRPADYPFDPDDESRTVASPVPHGFEFGERCIIRGGAFDVGCVRATHRCDRRTDPFEDVGFRVAVIRAE